ncbi:hypothetical protein TNCV_4801981 [Trichonephila clavipes]|nr:hypothetical protein TNCV_4801981 [Trichonephila clavipes]
MLWRLLYFVGPASKFSEGFFLKSLILYDFCLRLLRLRIIDKSDTEAATSLVRYSINLCSLNEITFGIAVSDADCYAVMPGFESRSMYGAFAAWGTLNSRGAVNALVRLEEGRKRTDGMKSTKSELQNETMPFLKDY